MKSNKSLRYNAVRMVLAAGMVMGANNAHAILGIGDIVFDPAALVQAINDYGQQISNYEEYIQQTALQGEQLAQAVQMYQQTMKSYEHMLRQMQELKNRADKKDWDAFARKYQRIIERSPGSSPDYSPVWSEASASLNAVYSRGSDSESYQELANSVGGSMEDVKALDARTQIATNQQVVVRELSEQNDDDREELARLDDMRVSLGSEDQLATVQFLAEQNQAMLNMQHRNLVQGNKMLEYSNQYPAHVFAREKAVTEAEMRAMQALRARTYEVDETPLVSW